MLISYQILAIGFWINYTLGQRIGVSSALGLGCLNCAQRFSWNFGCPNESVTAVCRCNNEAFMGTVVNCIFKHGDDSYEIGKGTMFIRKFCKYNGERELSADGIKVIYDNAMNSLSNNGTLGTSPSPDDLAGEAVTEPINIDPSTFESQFATAEINKRQYDYGSVFGIIMLAYWGLMIVGACIRNLMLSKFPHKMDQFTSPKTNALRKHLTLPALFNGKHGAPLNIWRFFTVLAPTRGQTLIIIIYLILNVLAGVLYYRIDQSVSSITLLRFVGIRTGIVSFTQLPLMLLFACRNNPMIYLTGWSYNVFNIYHHWIGRMVALHAIIHGTTLTVMAILDKSIIFRWESVINWRYGNVAVYAVIIGVLFSSRTMRQNFYEPFVLIHKIAFIIFIVGIYRHCLDFGWMPWINLTVVLYFYEQIVRLIRILWTGGPIKATISCLPGDEIVRVTIPYSSRWVVRAGQYCYIRFCTKSSFWQNHPFTIYRPVGDRENGTDFIQMMIKPKNGVTSDLHKRVMERGKIMTTGGNSIDAIMVLIEGPYGQKQPVANYKSVMFLAGGIGVTATYSYISEMLDKPQKHGQKLYFIWIVPDTSVLNWFGEEILNIMTKSDIKVVIYTTRSLFNAEHDFESKSEKRQEYHDAESRIPRVPGEFHIENGTNTSRGQARRYIDNSSIFIFSEEEYKEWMMKKQDPNYNTPSPSKTIVEKFSYILYDERPDIKETVKKYIQASEGTLSILSCGPPEFIDNIRDSIVQNINESESRIDYFEEAFSW